MSIEILDFLKRERDICVKTIITSQNTAFMWTPALNTMQHCHEWARRTNSVNKWRDFLWWIFTFSKFFDRSLLWEIKVFRQGYAPSQTSQFQPIVYKKLIIMPVGIDARQQLLNSCRRIWKCHLKQSRGYTSSFWKHEIVPFHKAFEVLSSLFETFRGKFHHTT